MINSTVHIVKMQGLVCQHIEPPSGSAFIHEHVVRKVTGSVKTKPNHSLTHHIPYNHWPFHPRQVQHQPLSGGNLSSTVRRWELNRDWITRKPTDSPALELQFMGRLINYVREKSKWWKGWLCWRGWGLWGRERGNSWGGRKLRAALHYRPEGCTGRPSTDRGSTIPTKNMTQRVTLGRSRTP